MTINSPDIIEELTSIAYETYSDRVGGKAWNGEPLPTWKDFSSDPNKSLQTHAWRQATTAILRAIDEKEK